MILFNYFKEYNYNSYILINKEKKNIKFYMIKIDQLKKFMNDIFNTFNTLIKKEEKEINFYYELIGYNDFQLKNVLKINLFKDWEIEPA